MGETTNNKMTEEMMKDTLLYVKLFNRKVSHLHEKGIMKTLTWLILIEQYGNPSISGLGRVLNVSKSQMTARLDKLVESGLIERVHDSEDRRIIRIVLTSEGQNFIKNYQKTVKESMDQLLSPLSHEEVKELKKSIKTIKNAVLKIQNVQNKK